MAPLAGVGLGRKAADNEVMTPELALAVGLLILGLLLGAAAGALVMHAIAGARLSAAVRDVARLAKESEEAKAEAASQRERATAAAVVQAQREAQLAELQGRVNFLDQAKDTLTKEFKAVSSEVLEASTTSLLDKAKGQFQEQRATQDEDFEERQKTIKQLTDPISTNLEAFKVAVTALENQRTGAYSELKTQVGALHAQTAELSQALRQPTVRGRWGEAQLRRVVELADLVEHVDFDVQAHRAGEEGAQIADMVVHLDDQRIVVVDSKVPIESYRQVFEAADDAHREALLDQHAKDVRGHISQLGRKAYWERFTPTPEFVVMFVPGESFLSAAFQRDPDLLEYGLQRNVLLVSPITLIAMLKGVAMGWRHYQVELSAQKIREMGLKLYDSIAIAMDRLKKLGLSLYRTVDAYNAVHASIESRVLPRARGLKTLSGGTKALVSVEAVTIVPVASDEDLPLLAPAAEEGVAQLEAEHILQDSDADDVEVDEHNTATSP